MFKWKPGDDVGALDDWPFEAPESDYRIERGAPKASGRLEAGGPGQPTRYGIWRCTEGAVSCVEQGDELMVILEGHCFVTDHATGEVTELSAGDACFSRNGRRVTWDVRETVTKVFFGAKAGGF